MTDEVLKKEVARKGASIQKQLTEHYAQWASGMEYRNIFPPLSKQIKGMGLSIMEFAYMLQDEGFIKLVNTPSGKKYVYAGDCPLTNEEINAQLMDMAASNG